jgi:GNAT superfamily N-acetyltransferase
MTSASADCDLVVEPLTPQRWADLEALFGTRGACGGCWCMWWRIPRRLYLETRGDLNKQAMRALVETGPPPGLLAFTGGQPVAWCAVGPRDMYPTLERSRAFPRLDEKEVWAVGCLFVQRKFRRRGLSVRMLRAAAEYSARCGARICEGYPLEPRQRLPDAFAWTGTLSAFRKAGFVEAGRGPTGRVIMRSAHSS